MSSGIIAIKLIKSEQESRAIARRLGDAAIK